MSDYLVDPFAVPTGDKIALLLDRSERLLASDGVAHTTVGLLQVKENKFYADTAGTVTTQQRVRVEPTMQAVAVDSDTGTFETMSTLAPPVGRGWEYLTGTAEQGAWDFAAEIPVIAETLREKTKSPSVQAGRMGVTTPSFGCELVTSNIDVLPPAPPRVKMLSRQPVARVQRSRLGNSARIAPESGSSFKLLVTELTRPSPRAYRASGRRTSWELPPLCCQSNLPSRVEAPTIRGRCGPAKKRAWSLHFI